MQVKCPQCHKPVVWSPDSPYRPFCSQRCKLIDLGAWANEDYQLPAQESFPATEHHFDVNIDKN